MERIAHLPTNQNVYRPLYINEVVLGWYNSYGVSVGSSKMCISFLGCCVLWGVTSFWSGYVLWARQAHRIDSEEESDVRASYAWVPYHLGSGQCIQQRQRQTQLCDTPFCVLLSALSADVKNAPRQSSWCCWLRVLAWGFVRHTHPVQSVKHDVVCASRFQSSAACCCHGTQMYMSVIIEELFVLSWGISHKLIPNEFWPIFDNGLCRDRTRSGAKGINPYLKNRGGGTRRMTWLQK